MSSRQTRLQLEKAGKVKPVKTYSDSDLKAARALAQAWIEYASSPASGLNYVPSQANALALMEAISNHPHKLTFDDLSSYWRGLVSTNKVTTSEHLELRDDPEVMEAEPVTQTPLELVVSQHQIDKMTSDEYRNRLRDPHFREAVNKLYAEGIR